jgi:hypothetical protein
MGNIISCYSVVKWKCFKENMNFFKNAWSSKVLLSPIIFSLTIPSHTKLNLIYGFIWHLLRMTFRHLYRICHKEKIIQFGTNQNLPQNSFLSLYLTLGHLCWRESQHSLFKDLGYLFHLYHLSLILYNDKKVWPIIPKL